MKKLISTILVCIMSFSFVGVNGTQGDDPEEEFATYANPILLTSEAEFDEFLSVIDGNRTGFFYKVTNDVQPLRTSTPDFTFAEIVIKHYDEVLIDEIYCVLPKYKGDDIHQQQTQAYNIEIPVPNGYKYHKNDIIRLYKLPYMIEAQQPRPLMSGVNIIQVFEDMTIQKEGDYYIINNQQEWDYMMDYEFGISLHYIAKDGVSITRDGVWPFWVNLKVSNTEIWRLGSFFIPGGGAPPNPNYSGMVFDLPYGYMVNGLSRIVINGNIPGVVEYPDISDEEISKMPKFDIGSIVVIDGVISTPLEKVATPTASPNGGTFTGSQSVTLSSATEGSVIYYTTNGTTPTTASTQYNGAFTLTATTTIKAIATKEDMADSDVLTVTYTKQSSGGNPSGGGGSPNPNIITRPTTNNNLEGTASQFSDVNSDDWFYSDVKFAIENGLFNGLSDTEFAPNATMTRAMIITVLARLAEVDTNGGDAWYSQAVEWGVANGITDGLDLESDVTREQVAVILARYLDFIGAEIILTQEYRIFTDEDEISDYAKNAIQTMNKLGILSGKGNDVIDPQGNATRAEVAAMLRRFAEAIKQ